MSRFRAIEAGVAAGILLSAAGPAAAENLLRWGNADDAKTADPHSYVESENEAVMQQIYDTLVALDSDMDIAGHLAVAWQPLDPTTWEFELRQGVRFHDGTPFTAEDVVFSIRRAQTATSDAKDFLRSVVEIQATDQHTVRFTTDGPDSLLWANLARVRILSKRWAEAPQADRVYRRAETPHGQGAAVAPLATAALGVAEIGLFAGVPTGN
jgi:peptide/nickel transport system substrate-binding protein